VKRKAQVAGDRIDSFEKMAVPGALTSMDGTIIEINQAFFKALNISPEKARTLKIQELLHPKDFDHHQMEKERLFAGKKEAFIHRCRLFPGEGDPIWMDACVSIIKDKGIPKDYLYVFHDINELYVMTQRLEELTSRDQLTGAYKEDYFFDLKLKNEWARWTRYRRPFALLYIDLDMLRSINDYIGRRAGDEALKLMAGKIAHLIRENDFLGRVQGGEFALFLAETKIPDTVANRIHREIKKMVVRVEDKKASITVSVGASTVRESDTSIKDVLNRAKEMLIKAKSQGRDQVHISQD